MHCDPKLWTFLAAQNTSLDRVIQDVLRDAEHPLHPAMLSLHASVGPASIEQARSTAVFPLLFGDRSAVDQDYWARIWAMTSELGRDFVETRIRVLRSQTADKRPPPYAHAALSGVEPDDDFLVPLRSIERDGSIKIGGIVCQATQTKPSPNSMYWAMGVLRGIKGCQVRIRLDPLLVCPVDEYSQVAYLMTVYGVPLDWQDITTLRAERHGRWMPDPGWQDDVAFTDVVWTPRDDGVHFQCEEVPKPELADARGARYFHSIYQRESGKFIHADGALRIYSEPELTDRQGIHLRNTGKVGARAKVFVADGEIEAQAWCELVGAYFVWNRDVESYVGGKTMVLETDTP